MIKHYVDNIEPEKTDLNLGFIPLADCCVLVIAKELGFFEKHGLDVELHKEASWANIRDKVCVGALDGAHMLAGIPIATTLGLGFTRKPMLTGFAMNLNGNAITVTNKLYERLLSIDNGVGSDPMKSAKALKKLIDDDKEAGKNPLTFATVYPFSNHNYEIRYWMASVGIDPDKDVRLRVIPPQYMVENLKEGQIDGFCVGGPWNIQAMEKQVGRILVSGYEIWNNSPEKVFGVTSEWNDKYPYTHICIIKALIEASEWIERAGSSEIIAKILSQKKYINIPENIIFKSISGNFVNDSEVNSSNNVIQDYNVFNRYQANYPWCSHAMWIILQMYRWGQLEDEVLIKYIAQSVYKPKIYREAADYLGISYPGIELKKEGVNNKKWVLDDGEDRFDMGPDSFFDRNIFDPDKPIEYLKSFEIKNLSVDIDSLKKLNN